MSLLFNILSRFVMAFLPRSKSLNFMAAVTVHHDFGAQENKTCHCTHCFPIYLPRSDRTRCHDLLIFVFWMLSFSFPSFTSIERLFSSSSISAIKVVSSAYQRLLIFLPEILIPACVSSSQAFHMMHTPCKLTEHSENIQLWCIPFPIWNKFVVPYPVVTVDSWPCIQISQEAGQVIWYSHLFKNVPWLLGMSSQHSTRSHTKSS